jgi:O-antigen/teichoic acid export membrane protein
MALLVLGLSSAFSSELRLTFIIFAVSLPLLSAQDYSRYLGISRYNPAYAIGLDASWLFLSVVGYFVLRHAHLVSLPWLFGSWSAAGAAVGIYTLWNHLGRRDLRQLIRFWFKSERGVGFRFAGQWLLVSSWTYAAIYIFIAIFSVAVIGQFKLAQLAFGPITVLSQGIVTSMVALAARYFQVDVSKALRFVLLAGAATAAVMLSWGALVYFLPVHAMTSALGPTWPAAHRMVPLMGLAFALTTLSGAFAAGLRSIRAAKENLRLSIVMIPVLFGCSVTAGILWGVIAAIAGICVGYGIYSVAAFAMLVHCARRITPAEIAVEDETDTVIPIEADNQNGALPAPVVFETVEPV